MHVARHCSKMLQPVRAYREKRRINPNPAGRHPDRNDCKTVLSSTIRRATTPLVIAVLLRLKLVVTPERYGGGWLPVSSACSYCMACYRATCNTPCILTKFPNAPWIYYSADPETLESRRKLKIRENFAAFSLGERERERVICEIFATFRTCFSLTLTNTYEIVEL